MLDYTLDVIAILILIPFLLIVWMVFFGLIIRAYQDAKTEFNAKAGKSRKA